MIYVDISQASRGTQRAKDDTFKNFNALVAADVQAQQANEFFTGAEGRQATTFLESQRQVGLAAQLLPELDAIIGADRNQILGQAATTNVNGLLQQATAEFNLPNIPTLGGLASGTTLANAQNTNFQSTTLTPQRQTIQQNQNIQTQALQPTQFATQAAQTQLQFDLQAGEDKYQKDLQAYNQQKLTNNRTNLPQEQNLRAERLRLDGLQQQLSRSQTTQAITTQPLRNTIETGQLQLSRDLQSGEDRYQKALQVYNQQKLNNGTANLPLENALRQERLRLDTLKAQLGNAQTTQDIGTQPTRNRIQNSQLAGDEARQPSVQAGATAAQTYTTAQQQFALQYQSASQAIQRQRQQILAGATSYELLSQAKKQQLATLDRDQQILNAQAEATLQPQRQDLTSKTLSNAIGAQEILQKTQANRASVAEIQTAIQLNQITFEQLNQSQRQQITRDNILVESANISQALKLIPERNRLQILQSGIALTDAQSARNLQQYAITATEIQAKDEPRAKQDALAVRQFKAQVQRGVQAIQRLNYYSPTDIPATALAQAAGELRTVGLLSGTQTLAAEPQGIVIKSQGDADIPIAQLYQGLKAAQGKAQGKPATFSVKSWVKPDGGVIQIPSMSTTGAPTAQNLQTLEELRGGGDTAPAAVDYFGATPEAIQELRDIMSAGTAAALGAL